MRRLRIAFAACLWACLALADVVPNQQGLPAQNWPGGAGIAPVVQAILGGSGYAVNDTIVLKCPAATFPTQKPQVTVTSVTAGAITGLSVSATGLATFGPPDLTCSQFSTSGSGSGAAFAAQLEYVGAGLMQSSGVPALPSGAAVASVFGSGTSATLTGPYEIYTCTGACNITLPAGPSSGSTWQFCIKNANNIATAITVTPASGVQVQLTTNASYKSLANPIVSTGTLTDSICYFSVSATQYNVASFTGTWN